MQMQNIQHCKTHSLPNKQSKHKFQLISAVLLCVVVMLFTIAYNLYAYKLQFDTSNNFNYVASRKLQDELFQNSMQIQSTSAVKKVYNIQQKDKQFAGSQNFAVKINRTSVNDVQQITLLRSLDLWDKIQIRTNFDYLNLTNQINFEKLKQQLANSISYQLIAFTQNVKLNKAISKIQIGPWANSVSQKIIQQSIYGSKKNNQQFQLSHSIKIAENPNNMRLKQQQYYYYDNKYKISKAKQELPLCLYGAGYKIYSKNRHIQYFQSIQRQNYTNFHIVYVDDNSPEQQILGLVKYLEEQKFSLKNKIQIIHNLQRLGPLANLYFWVNKFCASNEIVVHLDTDDSLLGAQALQVINANYENPQVWFLYSKYLLNLGSGNYEVGYSKPIRTKTAQYRHKYEFWDVSALRSFRKKLFQKIPLDAAIEYHIDEKTNTAQPRFVEFAYDAFEIFPLLQMAGDQRIKHISDYLYIYSGSGSNDKSKKCYSLHQKVDDFKFRIKTPFKMLKNINQNASYVENYKGNDRTTNTFRKVVMYNYRRCKTKQMANTNDNAKKENKK